MNKYSMIKPTNTAVFDLVERPNPSHRYLQVLFLSLGEVNNQVGNQMSDRGGHQVDSQVSGRGDYSS